MALSAAQESQVKELITSAIANAPLNALQEERAKILIETAARKVFEETLEKSRQDPTVTRQAMDVFTLEFTQNEERQKSEHQKITEAIAAKTVEIEMILTRANEQSALLAAEIASKEQVIQTIAEDMNTHTQVRDQIIKDLEQKRVAMETLNDTVQEVDLRAGRGLAQDR